MAAIISILQSSIKTILRKFFVRTREIISILQSSIKTCIQGGNRTEVCYFNSTKFD